MKLLVTGAAGRLGRPLTERFARDHEIVAYDRADPPEALPDSVHYIQGDLRDADQVHQAAAGAEIVVHLGAIPGQVPSVRQSEIFAINVQGTYHVLDAAARAGARTVVLASSLCAIGFPDSLDDHGLSYLPVDEDHPCRPRHAYDLSKLTNEHNAEMVTRLTGITTICFRFPALLDVRNAPWLPLEDDKDPPRLPLGDYLDLQDAVSVIETAFNRRDLTHEVLFIAAETSGTRQPTPAYIKRFEPPLEWRGDPPTDTTPLINCAKLKRVLNFTPTITWQQGRADLPGSRGENNAGIQNVDEPAS